MLDEMVILCSKMN